jgi:hypothetical protein
VIAPPEVREMGRVADRPLLLAVALARRGATFVVVGSAADRLTTGQGLPADLDILVRPGAVPALARALTDLTGSPVRVQRLLTRDCSRFLTWLGPVDVFIGDLADTGAPDRRTS